MIPVMLSPIFGTGSMIPALVHGAWPCNIVHMCGEMQIAMSHGGFKNWRGC